MDFEMLCENLVRKIFQCGRFNDPLGRLANTDSWHGLHDDGFSIAHKCKIWAVLARLQNEYLDSVKGRDELYNQAQLINERLLAASTNQELFDIMLEINEIVDSLNLEEFPHINYSNTNDKK